MFDMIKLKKNNKPRETKEGFNFMNIQAFIKS